MCGCVMNVTNGFIRFIARVGGNLFSCVNVTAFDCFSCCFFSQTTHLIRTHTEVFVGEIALAGWCNDQCVVMLLTLMAESLFVCASLLYGLRDDDRLYVWEPPYRDCLRLFGRVCCGDDSELGGLQRPSAQVFVDSWRRRDKSTEFVQTAKGRADDTSR